MIIDNINAQKQLIRHLETSIQEYKQNTTHAYIYIDIDKLYAVLINNSFMDLLITEASPDDPNMQIWADNHDKIRELFADKIEAIASRNQISFLDTTNFFLTHIHNNVNRYMNVMPVWYMYLFKYLICQAIIKVNAVSKINLNHVALFYNLFQRHYIEVEGHEPEFIQCMRLIITCQIEHMKNTVAWAQKNNPANIYYSQTVMAQLEQQASKYTNYNTVETEKKYSASYMADKNENVLRDNLVAKYTEAINQELLSNEEIKKDYLVIDQSQKIKEAEATSEEPVVNIEEIFYKDNQILLKQAINLQENNEIAAQNININDATKKSYATIKIDDTLNDDIENTNFQMQTHDDSIEENHDAKSIRVEKDNEINLSITKEKYLKNNHSKNAMIFNKKYNNKKQRKKQENLTSIYELIAITKKLMALSASYSDLAYNSITELKQTMNVKPIQESIEQLLEYDPFSFYTACMSVHPPLQESILVKLCSENIQAEFNNKLSTINLAHYSTILDRKIKSILNGKYSELENVNDIKIESNEELLPYINFLNHDKENILITYLRFVGVVDENIVMYIINNMNDSLFAEIDDEKVLSLCGFLFLHAVALEYHATNIETTRKFTESVIKLVACKHIASILDKNYLYSFDWFVILKGLGNKDDSVLFSEKVWSNFLLRLNKEGDIQNFLNNCLVDIFLYYPDRYSELSKKLIETISTSIGQNYINTDIQKLQFIIEDRCITYLNLYNNVIINFIEIANPEQLSLLITEKTLSVKNFTLQNQSLFNLLLHTAVMSEKNMQMVLDDKSHLFTSSVVNNENNNGYIDNYGNCISTPDIMPLICFYEKLETNNRTKKSARYFEDLMCQQQNVIKQAIKIFLNNIASLPKKILNKIKPETLTKNIIFNKEEQISLFVLLCINDYIDVLNEHTEFNKFLKLHFKNLTCMQGNISYLQLFMCSKKGVTYYEEHNLANEINNNAFNIKHALTGYKIGPANFNFRQFFCPTAGMMFILSNDFTQEELLQKEDILAKIDAKILEEKLPLTEELRQTTGKGRNVLTIKDMLKQESKLGIIERLKKNIDAKKSKRNNKVAFS